MAISGVNPKCYILALFVRDDGERFLLGEDPFEFKDNQLHFQPNTVANDVVEVQGNDGYLLAGQVRRPGTQMFDGYVCNGTDSKEEVEIKRRAFLQFFRRSHFYKVIYVFPNGTAIQRKQGFLVDDPTVQELYQQYPEYHVALNFEDVNYYTYEEDDQGHEIYAKEAIIKLAGGGATGGLIWDNNGVVWENPWSDIATVSGIDFQVNNLLPVRVPIEDTQLKGDTYQQTHSGKNKINGAYSEISQTVRCSAEASGNGFKITSTSSSGATYVTVPIPNISSLFGQTVTLSYSATGSGIRIGFFYLNSSGSATSNISYTQTTTLPSSLGSNAGIGVVFYTSNNGSATYTDIQLEIGSTATTYEPYTGGISAPNPDYPQDVQVVTGAQNVWVHGKNLLGMQNVAEFTQNGVKISVQDGVLSLDGTATASTGVVITTLTDDFIFQTDKSYTFSSQVISGSTSGSWAMQIRDSNSSTLLETLPNNYPTTYSGVSGVGVAVRLYYANGRSFNNYKVKIQAEEGSTATDFEPYQGHNYTIDLGSIELCKLGDYQDYIYKSGDDWYVHKAITKAIFDGTENWALHNTQNSINGFRLDANAAHSSSAIVANSYRAVPISEYNSANRGYYMVATLETGSTGSNYRIYMTQPNSSVITLANFTTWLGTNNVTAYYASQTPTDTKITDAALVEQLEALDAMRLFIGENNILVSTPTPNLPATLQLDYYTKYQTLSGAEWEEGGTKGATIVDVDAIDNTYPVWELIGPAINPTISVLTTNTTLTYNGTITASQRLVIDMFNKTATLNGTSVIGNVVGDFVYMAPGTNRVAYTAGNADAPDSTIYWQEVVG